MPSGVFNGERYPFQPKSRLFSHSTTREHVFFEAPNKRSSYWEREKKRCAGVRWAIARQIVNCVSFGLLLYFMPKCTLGLCVSARDVTKSAEGIHGSRGLTRWLLRFVLPLITLWEVRAPNFVDPLLSLQRPWCYEHQKSYCRRSKSRTLLVGFIKRIVRNICSTTLFICNANNVCVLLTITLCFTPLLTFTQQLSSFICSKIK